MVEKAALNGNSDFNIARSNNERIQLPDERKGKQGTMFNNVPLSTDDVLELRIFCGMRAC